MVSFVPVKQKSDVDSLNMLQLVSADKNIYFSSCGQHRDICRLFPRIQHLRSLDQIVVKSICKPELRVRH